MTRKIKIPKKYEPNIEVIVPQADGWIIKFSDGYCSGRDREHIVKEGTKKSVMAVIRSSCLCACMECQKKRKK